MERKKKRKLDKDERKLFAELARNYICALFGESDDEKKENDSRGSVHVNVKGETTHVRNNHSTVQESGVDKNCVKSSFTKVKNDQNRQTKDTERNIDNNVKSPTIEEQLRSVRENANKLFREKQKTSNGGTEAEKSELENKQFVGRKNAEDDMYKSMTYLERKAFALTNPYKLNKHVNSLKFGPDFSEPSDDKTDITSTNNKWLSKVNPSRNDVMFSPPTRGKRKRESSGSGRGKGANNSMKKDETLSRTPKRG